MEERASGIILRTRPLTETSVIVMWLTRECGRISTVAKGARRPKSPFVGKLDLFYEAEFSFARSRRSELHTLREVALRETHRPLREDIHWLTQAAYFGVLIELATETETPIPESYDLFRAAIGALLDHSPDPKFTLAFELKLLALLGFELDQKQPGMSAGLRAALRLLQEGGWEEIGRLRLSPSQQKEGNLVLMRAIANSLEKLPAQRAAASGFAPGN